MIQEEVGWLRPDPWTRLSLSSGHNVDHNCDHDHNDYHYCDYIYDHNCDHAHENNHNRLPCNAPKHVDAFFRLGPDGSFRVVHKLEEHKLKVTKSFATSNPVAIFTWTTSFTIFAFFFIKFSSLTSFIRLNRTKGTCRSTSTSLDTKLSRETGKVCCLAYLYFWSEDLLNHLDPRFGASKSTKTS